MTVKIPMQEVWMAGVDWDDLLPDDLNAKWEKWVSELPQVSDITVPRCLRLANPQTTELHLFSDASKVAFTSAAYLVCRYQDHTPSSRLVASKSRVSPVIAMIIPRLELMGAVPSRRLAQNVLKVISVDRVFRLRECLVVGPQLLPIELAKFKERQVPSSCGTYQER